MSLLPTVRRQIVGAAERQAGRERSSVAGRWRGGRLAIGGVLSAAMSVLAIVIAVGAVVLLGGHRSSSTPSARIGSASRQQLLQTLGVLRSPPTAADRRAIACAKTLPRPPSAAFRGCRTSGIPDVFLLLFPRTSRDPGVRLMFARWGYPRLDPSLIRVVALPHLHASVTLAPETWQPSRRSRQRNEGLDVTIAYSRGQTDAGPKPTSVATVRTHGLAVSDANATPQMRTVLGAVVVPDGVARVTLEPIRLVSPPAPLAPRRLGTVTAAVHDNVAAFRFPVPTATNRHKSSALYGVTVVVRAIWFDQRGNIIDRTTTQLYLSIRVYGTGGGITSTSP
jgi:hypothetical protein